MWTTALRVSRFCLRRPNLICRSVRLPILPPPAETLCVRREYSSQDPPTKRFAVFTLPNPILWLRTKIYSFLIRQYLDKDFNIGEFNEGARLAFLHVSRLLSQGKFEELENLVAKETLKDLENKYSELSQKYKDVLAAESNEIMHFALGDIGIYYEGNGRKFVNILMGFWYLKHVDLPNDEIEGAKIYHVVFGDRNEKSIQRILTAHYEFRREFTQGTKPDWIITQITHSKILE